MDNVSDGLVEVDIFRGSKRSQQYDTKHSRDEVILSVVASSDENRN